jgi:hypothetical protein
MQTENSTVTVSFVRPVTTMPLQDRVPPKRIPVGLLIWWIFFLFLMPICGPAIFTELVTYFSKHQVVNGFDELVKNGDCLLAIGVFACAVAFDAYVLKTRRASSHLADFILLLSLLSAGLVILTYPCFKIFGLSAFSPDWVPAFFWGNVALYIVCGALALILRWPDMSSAINGGVGS